MKQCSIDELELSHGEKYWIVYDETTGDEIKEFYENEGNDIEIVRMWAVNQGYTNIVFI